MSTCFIVFFFWIKTQNYFFFFFFFRGCQEAIANSRIDIEAARLLTLSCAAAIDEHGAVKARDKIAMIKVAVPNLALKVIDRAIQVSLS